MIQKRLLCPQHLRHVPSQFSWVDQRLVRDNHLRRCSAQAWAFYLFLVCVADAQGLSYYSDRRVLEVMGSDGAALAKARRELLQAGLIAYEPPLYQVLALRRPEEMEAAPPRSGAGPCSLAGLFASLGDKP